MQKFTLTELFLDTIAKKELKIVVADDFSVSKVELNQFLNGVRKFQSIFDSFNIRQSDFVAIISNTRLEWMTFDIASILTGTISVPIYPSLNTEDIRRILSLANVKLIIAENEEQIQKVQELGYPIVSIEKNSFNVPDLSQFSPNTDLRVNKTSPDSIVTLMFTSGTEGLPKGVPQTHLNHTTNLFQVSEVGLFSPSDRIYLFLPLSHSFGRLCGYVGCILGVETVLLSPISRTSSKIDLRRIVKLIPKTEPTIIPAVPRFFEHLRQELEKKLSFILWVDNLFKGDFIKKFLGRFLIPKLFGNQIRFCISGGAKLSIDTIKFFDCMGLLILEGYGLTETCVATHVNLPGQRKIGSVGRPLPGIEQKIVDEEIFLRGKNIFSGYWFTSNQPFTKDGWFKTGDIGQIDEDGFLYVLGRKKEIIVLQNGKNIPVLKLESELSKLFKSENVAVFGDGKDYVVGIIFFNTPLAQLDYYREKLNELNSKLNPFEKIKSLLIVQGNLTVENGFLTPTLKMKKNFIYSYFYDEFEELFSKPYTIKISNKSI